MKALEGSDVTTFARWPHNIEEQNEKGWVEMQIIFIEGDMRQQYLQNKLERAGHTGRKLPYYNDKWETEKRNRYLKWIQESDAIVFPIPTGDAVECMIPMMQGMQWLFGGAVSERIRKQCKDYDIKCFDYLQTERALQVNTKATAEGVLAVLESWGESVREILVIGYGNCGSKIAELCRNCGMQVWIQECDRDRERLAKERGFLCGCASIKQVDAIVNTAPVRILDEKTLRHIANKCRILDIASGTGGTDFEYCRKKGIHAQHELGIPGKWAPELCGSTYAEVILEVIEGAES